MHLRKPIFYSASSAAAFTVTTAIATTAAIATAVSAAAVAADDLQHVVVQRPRQRGWRASQLFGQRSRGVPRRQPRSRRAAATASAAAAAAATAAPAPDPKTSIRALAWQTGGKLQRGVRSIRLCRGGRPSKPWAVGLVRVGGHRRRNEGHCRILWRL